MKRITLSLATVTTLLGVLAYIASPSVKAAGEANPIFVTEIPSGYRDWKLISVAHEEGNIHSIGAILGNDVAIKAYREGKLPYPDGTIIAASGAGLPPMKKPNPQPPVAAYFFESLTIN